MINLIKPPQDSAVPAGGRGENRAPARFSLTTLACPDCATPLWRFCTAEDDDYTGCPACGLGVWSDAPCPARSLIAEFLPEELRWQGLLAGPRAA